MALSQSVVSELLDAFRTGEGLDLIRDAVALVLQELIELEATEAVGAGRYERSQQRVTERNGHRPRLLATQAGDVELKIPKLRKGSFFPSILEPRRRIDQALYAVVMAPLVSSRGGLVPVVVGEEGAVDDVGEPPFDAAHGLASTLALGDLAAVVVLAGGGLANLGEGHDVQRRVELAVPDAGQPVSDDFA